MEVELEKMDTSSAESPAPIVGKKITNCDTEETSNHSEPAPDSIAVSKDGTSENTKTNGVVAEDDESSENSQDSQSSQEEVDKEKNKDAESDKEKPAENHISDSDSKTQTNEEATVIDSQGEDTSEDEGSDEENQENSKDALSVNSDSDPETVDDSTRDAQSVSDNNDIVMVENNEVHEIDSDEDDDDCIVTNTEAPKSVNGGSVDSDVEMEVDDKDPLNHNDDLVAKLPKSLLKSNLKNTSLTIVKTDAKQNSKSVVIHPTKITSSIIGTTNSSISENLAARGCTMTDVTVKSNNVASQSNNAPLLPTLTDDMFVVEAPSFIVPYVYEKPSLKPFREFVDVLGKELDEKRAKEEKERLEKEKEEKERRRKEKEEKRALGEEVSDSEDEKAAKEKQKEEKKEESKKDEGTPGDKKPEKKKGRKIKNDEDDASWDGESDDSEDQVSDDDELSTVVIKDKGEDDIEEIKSIATKMAEESLTVSKPSEKIESFFDNNLGKFFMNIGLNLVQEYVQADLLKQQKHKYRRESKHFEPSNLKEIESAIKYLTQNLNNTKKLNEQYHFEQKYCKFCSFKTESALIMAHHLETPHMKNNTYSCNFCSFEIKSPHDILFHTEAEHNIRSRLERAPAYHQCANCPFEDNGKGKLARHIVACAKKFKPELNLAPPLDWEPPAKIPKLSRGKNSLGSYNRPVNVAPLGRPPMIQHQAPILGRPRGPSASIRGQTILPGAPAIRGGVMIRPTNVPINFNAANQPRVNHQPSISITPLPRQPQPPANSKSQGSFVICEICDGYIKDLEQLRSHMQWIHKVKIHPKMIYNRPPLNCQKCQFRFFTDQGLERHLLGSHGLVTSSMQETANQGKDSGRCPVCGRVYQWKLLNHVAKDHNMTLKPAHLSYKCTVCTATFGMYKQFESHVYSAHSAVGKRMADGGKPPNRVGNSSITIIPSGKSGKV